MKIHQNSLRLAGFYLAILMAISLFFSVGVYQLSTNELERSLRWQPGTSSILNRLPLNDFTQNALELLRQEREAQLREAKARVVQRLLLINVLILLGGGLLSYYLALRTLKPIEEAHEAQSRFTADASHELRTPIAAMQTETEVALMDPKLTLGKAKALMRSNIEELSKLTALSEGLLRLARSEHDELALSPIPLAAAVQKAVDNVMPLAEKKHILIRFDPPAGDIQVHGEPASLTEALVIILDNAIKYSSEKTEVRVTVEPTGKDVVVKIADAGIGIKAAELPHIFGRFYRADSSRSKHKTNGYGLGLAIAKRIVEMHHGDISVTSKPSKGSVFSVRLPRT